MELRPATAEDRPFLLALYESGRSAEITAWGWSGPQLAQFIAMQFAARWRQYDLAYPHRDDRLVLSQGKAVGLLSVARRATEMRLVDLALLPEFQGQGAGSLLVRGVQREAAERGVALRLHLQADNSLAGRFYHRLGFSCIEDDGVYCHLEWRPAAPRPDDHTANYPSEEVLYV